MESKNMGVCKHSSSSRLDDLVHRRFFYDLPLQLLDSSLLNAAEPSSLGLFNYLVTQTSGVITSKADIDTVVLDKRNTNARCLANRLLYQFTPITTAFILRD